MLRTPWFLLIYSRLFLIEIYLFLLMSFVNSHFQRCLFSNFLYKLSAAANRYRHVVTKKTFLRSWIKYRLHVTFTQPMLSQTKNELAWNIFACLRCQLRGRSQVQMIKFITLTKTILATVCSCFYFCMIKLRKSAKPHSSDLRLRLTTSFSWGNNFPIIIGTSYPTLHLDYPDI